MMVAERKSSVDMGKRTELSKIYEEIMSGQSTGGTERREEQQGRQSPEVKKEETLSQRTATRIAMPMISQESRQSAVPIGRGFRGDRRKTVSTSS